MDEEQQRKFEEWWEREKFLDASPVRGRRGWAEIGWEACLEANKVETQEPEPTPTEMVKRLLEKGWTIVPLALSGLHIKHQSTNDYYSLSNLEEIGKAYIKAFPRKKKVEVEVWLDSDGCVRVIPPNSDSKGLDPKRVSWGWTKGTATFWVEDSDE